MMHLLPPKLERRDVDLFLESAAANTQESVRRAAQTLQKYFQNEYESAVKDWSKQNEMQSTLREFSQSLSHLSDQGKEAIPAVRSLIADFHTKHILWHRDLSTAECGHFFCPARDGSWSVILRDGDGGKFDIIFTVKDEEACE